MKAIECEYIECILDKIFWILVTPEYSEFDWAYKNAEYVRQHGTPNQIERLEYMFEHL